MKAVGQFLLAIVAIIVLFTVVGRFDQAQNTDRPNDMPADAHFLVTGYDVNHLEAHGDWVACRLDAPQSADFCRVTDQKGVVVFQGDFLPLSAPAALADDQLAVGNDDPQKMWVNGPAEAQPVPVITLASGERLVPIADRDALVARWNQQPDELAHISEPVRQ